jgi:peptidoglycan/xylan/chitin deacetylase (PgdA/CDA1 family)
MNNQKLVIRNDDFDFRMLSEFYIAVHEYFIANDLIETAVVQLTKFGKIPDFEAKKETIDYMNTAPNWDIQIHGWSHDHYHEMVYDEIVRDMSAALFHFQKLFNKLPTVWYPPYNGHSGEMERAASTLGLTTSNEDMPIRRFVDKRDIDWEDGKFKCHSLYFHGWKDAEMEYFEKMIRLAGEVIYGTSKV